MDEYKLPHDIHEEIYRKLEREMLADSEPPQEHPRVVILGGQPGSGKSKLIELALGKMFAGKNPAIINGDDYRARHPQLLEILKADDKQFAENTDPDVRNWTKRLFDAAIAHRRDIIFEGTMRTKAPVMETIRVLHEKGYEIDILTMALCGDVSRTGVLVRYERQKEQKGYGRWTAPESHDEAYINMPDTVMAIENESPIDSIRVYNRAGELLYENIRQDGAHAMSRRTADARAAIVKERIKPLTPAEQRGLDQQRRFVEMGMLARKAPAGEVSVVKTVMADSKDRERA